MKGKRKTFRSLITMIMVVALCLSFAVPALAADVQVAANNTGSYSSGGYSGDRVAQSFVANATADLKDIHLWLLRTGGYGNGHNIGVRVRIYDGTAISDFVLESDEIISTTQSNLTLQSGTLTEYTFSDFNNPVHFVQGHTYIFEVARVSGDSDSMIKCAENDSTFTTGSKYDYNTNTSKYTTSWHDLYDMQFVVNGTDGDTTAPTLSSVSISSSNTDTTLAKVGDTITLSFTASEALQAAPTVKIAGHTATAVQGSGNNYTASYTMQSSDTEGTIPFSISNYSDTSGNAGTTVSTTMDNSRVLFDKTAPTNPEITNSTAWTNAASVNVSISAGTDSGSGVAGVMYQLSGATTQGLTAYAGAFDITNAGTTTITAYTVDYAGNVSGTVTSTVNIDRTAPTFSVTKDPTGFTNGNVKLTVNASDTGGSGIASTNGYSFDGGANWQTSETAMVSENGTVNIRVKDAAGNISDVYPCEVNKIDKAAPTIQSVDSDPSTWTNGSVTLTVNATDATDDTTDIESGIAVTNGYSFNGVWQNGNSKTVTANGTYNISVKDTAGNTASTTFTVSNIDTEVPEMTLSQSPSSTTPTNGIVTITPNASDITSGVNPNSFKYASGAVGIDYFENNGTLFTTGSFEVSENGTYTVFASDNAGNPVIASITITNIDKESPTVTLDLAAGQAATAYSTPVNFKVTFSEPVTGFTADDVTVSGSAGATMSTVTGSGTSYNVAVSGITGEGTVIVSIEAGAADDLAYNPSLAPVVINDTVTCTSAALDQVTVGGQTGSVISETPGSVTYTVVPEWNGTNIFGTYDLSVVWDSTVPDGVPTGVTTQFDDVLSTRTTRVHKLTVTTDSTTMEGTYKFTVQATQGSTVTSVPVTFIVGAPEKTDPVITWAAPASIVYGTALSAVQQNATASVEGTFTYGFNIGDILNAGTNNLTVTFIPQDARHYNSVSASVQIIVTPAPLTITANSDSRVYGQSNPTFTYHIDGFVPGDTETTALSGTPSLSCSANTSSPANATYPITVDLTGVSAANYSITTVPGQLTITQATYEDFVFPTGTLTYGQSLAQAALTSGSYPGSYTFDNGSLVPSVSDSGTYYAATFVPQDSNYKSMTGTICVTVKKAVLTVTADDLEKFYGEPNPSLENSYQITGYVNGDTASVITGTPSLTCLADETTTISPPTVPITVDVSNMQALNYTFTPVDGSLTIKQATPEITWPAPAAITYGTTLSGILNATSPVSGSFVYKLPNGSVITNDTILDRGQYTLKAVFTPVDNTNYKTNEKEVSLTVNPAALTIKAKNKTIIYGEALPSYTVGYSDFVLGEDELVLSGTLSFTANTGSVNPVPAGTYTITPSGLTSDNYEITFDVGTLTIEPKSISTYAIDAISPQLWTGSAIEPTVTVQGLNADDFEVKYIDNTDPGTATVEVTGKDNYKNTISASFIITIPYVPSTTNNEVTAASAGAVSVSGTNPLIIKVVFPDTASARPDDDTMNETVLPAIQQAESAGFKVILDFEMPDGGTADTMKLTLTHAQLSDLAATNAQVEVGGFLGKISFNATAFDSIYSQAGTSNVTFTVTKLNSLSLTAEERTLVGDRPVFDFSVTAGSTTITDFGGGKATVSIPYTPTAEELESGIVIYYMSDDGPVMVTDSVYNTETGMVTFTTEHLSVYGVGYKTTSFTNSTDWYAEFINYLAARGIVDAETFSPDTDITRAEFVVILAKIAGADLSGYTTPSFDDVAVTDSFFAAVEWASANKIVEGYEGLFSPNAPIARQDISTILMRYASNIDFTMPELADAMNFSDSALIADYAQSAVAAMQQALVLNGYLDGSFKPTDNMTQAEVAKVFAVFMQLLIEF